MLRSPGELVLITHIGPSKAAEVVGLRPFSSLEDLTRISGISSGRVEDIKAQGIACVSG